MWPTADCECCCADAAGDALQLLCAAMFLPASWPNPDLDTWHLLQEFSICENQIEELQVSDDHLSIACTDVIWLLFIWICLILRGIISIFIIKKHNFSAHILLYITSKLSTESVQAKTLNDNQQSAIFSQAALPHPLVESLVMSGARLVTMETVSWRPADGAEVSFPGI